MHATGHVAVAWGVENLVIAVSEGCACVSQESLTEVRRLVEEIRQRGWSRVL